MNVHLGASLIPDGALATIGVMALIIGLRVIDVSAGVMLVADVGQPQQITVETDRGDFKDFEIDVLNFTVVKGEAIFHKETEKTIFKPVLRNEKNKILV